MTKQDIARVLREIAFFLRFNGDNPFKARAYERAASSLLLSTEELSCLVKGEGLMRLVDVGPGTASVIRDLATTGWSQLHRTVQGAYPSSLAELGEVPGLRFKQIRKLYERAGISTLAGLQEACRANRLLSVKGIGPKIQQRMMSALGEYQRGRGYRLLADVLEEAASLERALSAGRGVRSVTAAGGLRRKMEVIDEFVFVVECRQGDGIARVARQFNAVPYLTAVTASADRLTAHTVSGMPVQVVFPLPDHLGVRLLQSTGAQEHVDELLDRFAAVGLPSWRDVENRFSGAGEEELYRALDLPCIPPEVREGREDLDALKGRKTCSLVEAADLQGCFHFHTDYSDGEDTVDAMVAAARARGYRYVGISDHSRSAFYANGLKEPRIRRQWEEIEAVQGKHRDIHIFRGIEADILPDGSMDYADELLAEFDFVIASVHSRFNLPEADQTARICRALANPYVTMLGHPTGRLLLSRPGYRVDMGRIFAAAAAHRKIIEINGSRHRLDMDWRWGRAGKAQGVRFCINPDAHAIDEFRNVDYGVNVARKAGLLKADVVNTLPLAGLQGLLKDMRPSESSVQ
ncbi:DNA polymerase/3'-5' exonuclease PolX [Nitrospira sp. KM1]|uniref:PHP domain-containing protein n=1 Tax=Nitrospira sp. KM1 TaxID=1936990 RepID=UPI0013A74D4C|nr:PHP domain-containing protein [Nitrospira sp. KM1]BCA56054.1 DNA polymerase/3'-5' exonuclease PolX [Nitrospira sp. KM1]